MIALYILIAVIGLCASPSIYLFLGKITRPLSALFVACAETLRVRPEDLFTHTKREVFMYTYHEVMDFLDDDNEKFFKFVWPLIRIFHFVYLLFFTIIKLWATIAMWAIIIFYRIKTSSKNKDSKKNLRRVRK